MRWKLTAAAALAAATLLAPSAHAARVDFEGDTLVFRAAPGEENHLEIGHERGTDHVVVTARGVPKITVGGTAFHTCTPAGFDARLECTRSKVKAVRAELGDGRDAFFSDEAFPITVDAGSGDDHIGTTSVVADPFSDLRPLPSQVDVIGGPGRDIVVLGRLAAPAPHLSELANGKGVTVTKNGVADDGRPIDRNNIRPDVEILLGSGGDDELVGGPGPDVFISSGGNDAYYGLSGDDTYLMGARKDGPTRAIGGGGRDTVSYAKRTEPIVVTADDPTLRDGEAGENDQLEGIDAIEGGSGPDNMVTPLATAVGYRLVGGPGNDTLSTGDGADRLVGGPGEDRLFSAGRADVIEARDGELDRVDCGTNGDDRAEVDKLEREFRGCENRLFSFLGVPRMLPGRADARPGRPVRLAVEWRHPVDWARLETVGMTLSDRGRTVARAVLDQETRKVRARGRGVRVVPGSVAVDAVKGGRRVVLRVALQIDRRYAGRTLTARLSATDDAGRRQRPRRVGTVRVRR